MVYYNNAIFILHDESASPRPVKTARKFKKNKSFWTDSSNFKGDAHFEVFHYGICRGGLKKGRARYYGTVMVEYIYYGPSDLFAENVEILKEKLKEFMIVIQVNYCQRKELYGI